MATIFARSAIACSFVLATLAVSQPAAAQKKSSDRSVITAEDIAKYPEVPIEIVVQRRVPGVSAIRTEGGYGLLIRGAATVVDGEPKWPLYVVDTVPVQSPDGSWPQVDREEIATIKVLKGSDAGLYGIDGANGVIVITTKRSGPPKQ